MTGISSKRTAPLPRLLVDVSVTLATMEQLCFWTAAIAMTDHRVSMASAQHIVSSQSGCEAMSKIWSRHGAEGWVRWTNFYHPPIAKTSRVDGTASPAK